MPRSSPAGEVIKDQPVRFGVEQRLLIALTVDVDKERPKLTKERLSRELIVDEDLASPAGRQLSPNDQLSTFAWFEIDTRRREQCLDQGIWLERKESFDRATLRARFKKLRTEAASDQYAERIDYD